MTCREKLTLEHPELVDEDYFGQCADCPSTYGYLGDPDFCPFITTNQTTNEKCTKCWDREIPEEKKGEDIMYKPTYGTLQVSLDQDITAYVEHDIMTTHELWKTMNVAERQIENVIFNNPATIVFWADGTKTVVKADSEDFDPEKGLAMAIAKKFYGNTGRYFDIFKKWIPADIKRYDENGDLVYRKDFRGFEEFWEYDENGNLLCYRDSSGWWYRHEYDEKGRDIKYENANGYYEITEYDDDGRIVYRHDSNGSYIRITYDEKGRTIYSERTGGWQVYYGYDRNGYRAFVRELENGWVRTTRRVFDEGVCVDERITYKRVEEENKCEE